jgi:hypothetical protein
MASVVISDIEFRVRKDTWVERARRVQGQDVVAKDNTLMSTKNPYTEKRAFDFQTSFFDATEEAAVRAAVQAGVPHVISGDLVGDTIVGYVTIGDVPYKKWSADGSVLRRLAAIHIDQE